MRWRWRRRKVDERNELSEAEAAAARMREALVPLNEQLHSLAAHISSMRTALSSTGRGPAASKDRALVETALDAAEASYRGGLRVRDTILGQAEELHNQSRHLQAELQSRTARSACETAARNAEESVRRELATLTEATARLEARVELIDP